MGIGDKEMVWNRESKEIERDVEIEIINQMRKVGVFMTFGNHELSREGYACRK